MAILHVTDAEWELAEKIMLEQIKQHPNMSFKIRRKENHPLNKQFIHSFIVVNTETGPILYAQARDKHYDEGYLGEGARGKVKVLESRQGDMAALKIEPELEPDVTREQEIAVLNRRGHIYGTFTRLLDHSVEWLDGEETNEKIYSILKLHPGMDMYEGYIEKKEMSIGRLNQRQALLAAIKIAKEIKELHDNDEIHRDIKEANVILDQDPKNPDLIAARLVDFETVLKLPEGESSIEAEPVGSSGYCAPEAEEGTFSKASDVYALGRICQNLKIDEQTMLDDTPDSRPTIEQAIDALKAKLLPLCENKQDMERLIAAEPNMPNYRTKSVNKAEQRVSKPALSQAQVEAEKENQERQKMIFTKVQPTGKSQVRRGGGFLGEREPKDPGSPSPISNDKGPGGFRSK